MGPSFPKTLDLFPSFKASLYSHTSFPSPLLRKIMQRNRKSLCCCLEQLKSQINKRKNPYLCIQQIKHRKQQGRYSVGASPGHLRKKYHFQKFQLFSPAYSTLQQHSFWFSFFLSFLGTDKLVNSLCIHQLLGFVFLVFVSFCTSILFPGCILQQSFLVCIILQPFFIFAVCWACPF